MVSMVGVGVNLRVTSGLQAISQISPAATRFGGNNRRKKVAASLTSHAYNITRHYATVRQLSPGARASFFFPQLVARTDFALCSLTRGLAVP